MKRTHNINAQYCGQVTSVCMFIPKRDGKKQNKAEIKNWLKATHLYWTQFMWLTLFRFIGSTSANAFRSNKTRLENKRPENQLGSLCAVADAISI